MPELDKERATTFSATACVADPSVPVEQRWAGLWAAWRLIEMTTRNEHLRNEAHLGCEACAAGIENIRISRGRK